MLILKIVRIIIKIILLVLIIIRRVRLYNYYNLRRIIIIGRPNSYGKTVLFINNVLFLN